MKKQKNTQNVEQPAESNAGVAIVPLGFAPTVPAKASVHAYSRDAYVSRKPKRRRGAKIALAVVLVLLLAVGGVAFGGVMYVNSITDKLHKNVDQNLMQALSVEKAAPGEPFYMLVMGVDRSEERVAAGDMDTFRSDSIDPRAHRPAAEKRLARLDRARYVRLDRGLRPRQDQRLGGAGRVGFGGRHHFQVRGRADRPLR